MPIQMIVAHDPNRAIGKQWSLPRHYPADLQHFRQTTQWCPIVMGRGTYESIWRPLPWRTNIVLSRSLDEGSIEWCMIANSVDQVLTRYHNEYTWDRPLFIIGGQSVYESFLPASERLYITRIPQVVEDADTWFPVYTQQFECSSCKVLEGDDGLVVEEWKFIWENNKC